eukprot:11810732-Prorocentrum_lima.AAC.1
MDYNHDDVDHIQDIRQLVAMIFNGKASLLAISQSWLLWLHGPRATAADEPALGRWLALGEARARA